MSSPVLGHSTGQVGQFGQAGTYTGGQKGESWNGEELGVVPGIEKYTIFFVCSK